GAPGKARQASKGTASGASAERERRQQPIAGGGVAAAVVAAEQQVLRLPAQDECDALDERLAVPFVVDVVAAGTPAGDRHRPGITNLPVLLLGGLHRRTVEAGPRPRPHAGAGGRAPWAAGDRAGGAGRPGRGRPPWPA